MHLRHVDVEQNQVRLQFFGLPNSLQPIRRLHRVELRALLKRRANEMAEPRMILDDENPQRHGGVLASKPYCVGEGASLAHRDGVNSELQLGIGVIARSSWQSPVVLAAAR